jgi:LCP family protein required for cell wall assembly
LRRRAAFALAALCVWIAGGALGASGGAHGVEATPALQIGRAPGATHLPSLNGARPIFILVLGSDARPGEEVRRARSDSIHLVALNPRKGQGTILGFPRDSYVSIPGRGSARINTAMVLGGPELTVQTVESITGIQIDYYALTSFRGLADMINAVDGVVVDIPYPMSDFYSGADFEAGPQRLDGRQALAFSRNRKDTPNGDFSRSENQGRLFVAALQQFQEEFQERPSRLLTWLGAGLRNMETDVPMDELLALAFTATRIPPSRMRNLVVPGGIGQAGAASIVIISSAAQAIYADMRDDGIVGPPAPPLRGD